MPIAPPPSRTSKLGLLKRFLGIFLPLCAVLTVVGSMHYYTFYTTERNTIEASESLNVNLAKHTIVSDISSVISDLLFLAKHVEEQGLPDDLTYFDEKQITKEFLVFAEKKGLYDQIRYLNSSGMEIVRVNFSGGEPVRVVRRYLQNKGNRYYFKEALSQERGNIYISPLDLNIEGDSIEYPLKPMLRFATPVFDRDGEKKGVIVLNYFGDRLINSFKRAAANILDHVQLVNSDGYWLSSPDSKDEWGFMLGHNRTFSAEYKLAWEEIKGSDSGQIQTLDGLFTYATVSPRPAIMDSAPTTQLLSTRIPKDRKWKVISHISTKKLSASLPFFIQNHIMLYIAMFILIALITWFLAYSQNQYRLAEAQRDYEQRFRHTLENIDLAAIALNNNGEVTFCNDYFLGMTGWHRNEVVGKNWLDQFVPENLKAEVSNIIAHITDPTTFPSHYENQVKTKDGQIRLISWNNTLSYDTTGNVIGVTGIGEDITESKRAEEELRKLSSAVEQSPSVVMITDKYGQTEYVNPKFTEVSGYTQDEMRGKNPRLLKSGETSEDEYASLWHSIKQGKEWRGEVHNRKKSGDLYWEAAAISAIRNQDGEIAHFLAVKEDITERKRLESEVAERNRELSRSQAFAVMGRMASMIAHDLRNPLSSVKMTLQIIGKQIGPKFQLENDELRQISLEQIRYMEDILSDLLTYSKPDAMKPEWIDLERIMDMAIGLSQRRLEETNVKLTAEYHPGLPTVLGDATKLRQMLSNLITNAIQASENVENAKIAISMMLDLGQHGTGIRIVIDDNGCGIEDGDSDRLFEPFFTTRARGTGLGLAIVKRILDQHGGSIHIAHNTPRGTSVTLVLPVNPQINSSQQPYDNESVEL
ncbi:MAG: PAS domain S-box protein [Gammaproteobacteria bacterium]|nr:PAS domain S-box protein [Gammaproteobacteria bacterium]